MRTRKQSNRRRRRSTKQRGGSGKGVGGDQCTKTFYGTDTCLPGIACVDGLNRKVCDASSDTKGEFTHLLINTKDPVKRKQELLKKKHLINIPVNSSKRTLLSMLIESYVGTDPELVKLLITEGADVNAKSYGGETPLLKAMRAGRADLLPVLLENGARVNDVNDRGESALHATSNPECIAMLLDHGANVNAQNSEGATPLHLNVGNLEVVKILLAAGANKNLKLKTGEKPIDFAKQILGEDGNEIIALL